MRGAPILASRTLSAGYGDFQAIFSVDFDVFPGEIVALIGANGAGKSTLLKTLVGLVPAREGRVVLGGRSSDISRAEISNAYFGVQNSLLD